MVLRFPHLPAAPRPGAGAPPRAPALRAAGAAAPPRALSAFASVSLHALVLLVLAATSVRLAPERSLIPLVILNPAPPPPPPGPAGAGPAASVAAPAPVVPVAPSSEAAKPPRPKPAVRTEPRKIAAKPKPAPAPPAPVVEPAPAAPSAPAVQTEVSAPAAGGGGGVVGGVLGGQPGGRVGGKLGGMGDDVWRIDQVAVPPRVLRAVKPDYPAVARARGLEGVVVVTAIIDRSGNVEPDVQIAQSLPPFDDAAVTAFRRFRFRPGRNGQGETVRVIVRQPMRFQLR